METKTRRRKAISFVALTALLLAVMVPMAAFADTVNEGGDYKRSDFDPQWPGGSDANKASKWVTWLDGQFPDAAPHSCRKIKASNPYELTKSVDWLIINTGAATDDSRSDVWEDPEPGLYAGLNTQGQPGVSNGFICDGTTPEPMDTDVHVDVTKKWTVNGDDVTDVHSELSGTAKFSITVGDEDAKLILDGRSATFTLPEPDDYAFSISEQTDTLPPDPTELFGGEGETCELSATTYSFTGASEDGKVTAPGSLSIEATNAYTCTVGPEEPSATVTIEKRWDIDGDDRAPAGADPLFDVVFEPVIANGNGDGENGINGDVVLLEVDQPQPFTIENVGPGTITLPEDDGRFLTGVKYSVTVTEPSVPVVDDCRFVRVDIDPEQATVFVPIMPRDAGVEAAAVSLEPISATFTATNRYECGESEVTTTSVSDTVQKIWAQDGGDEVSFDEFEATFTATLLRNGNETGRTAAVTIEGEGTETVRFSGLTRGPNWSIQIEEDAEVGDVVDEANECELTDISRDGNVFTNTFDCAETEQFTAVSATVTKQWIPVEGSDALPEDEDDPVAVFNAFLVTDGTPVDDPYVFEITGDGEYTVEFTDLVVGPEYTIDVVEDVDLSEDADPIFLDEAGQCQHVGVAHDESGFVFTNTYDCAEVEGIQITVPGPESQPERVVTVPAADPAIVAAAEVKGVTLQRTGASALLLSLLGLLGVGLGSGLLVRRREE